MLRILPTIKSKQKFVLQIFSIKEGSVTSGQNDPKQKGYY